MSGKTNIGITSAEFRRLAEAQLRDRRRNQSSKAGIPATDSDVRRLHHELQVHQVELEMQNLELQEGRDRMEIQLEKYTALYDFAPVGYFSLDESGRILEANLTGATLLGVERSRLINGQLSRFMAPASQAVFLTFLKRVFAGYGKHACDAALSSKNSSAVFWIGIHGVCVIAASEAKKRCRVTISDITPLKEAEEKLRRSEALFSGLIKQAPVGVYVVDDQLRLQEVNPTAMVVFSKFHPWQGRDISEIIHAVWPDKVADEIVGRFRQTLKTGKPYYSREFTEQRRDIRVTEVYEWQLQRITMPAGQHAVACFFTNITERKRAEATQIRIKVMAASNRKLEQEIVRRQTMEENLKTGERQTRQLLMQSRQMQERLQLLSRQLLSAQEEERKKISRELHDVIAQTLSGIILQLENLKKEAAIDTDDLGASIARTQEWVEHAVDIVHQFARELRPAALDDLGLIPALHAFMKSFKEKTGIRAGLTAFSAIEEVAAEKRTALFRVAQEALTNVARHAHASEVEVRIQKLNGIVRMQIKDNGRGIEEKNRRRARKAHRLGLLGMKERLEMVGGDFSVTSEPGKGTTVQAEIPIDDNIRERRKKAVAKPINTLLKSL